MIVTPIPGAHRGNVLQVLRSVHTAAINLGTSHQPEENLLKYLTWATGSVRVPNSQIRPKDIDALVRTPQYWALLAGAGQINGRLEAALSNGLIDLEVRQRVEAFDLAVKAFTEQMTRWPESTSVLVLDTGPFIKHPTKFEETSFLKSGRLCPRPRWKSSWTTPGMRGCRRRMTRSWTERSPCARWRQAQSD
ncbi:hypothetical protein ACFV5J_37650 [Streptomyces zaomyceticus]|uniref:hypothetical protein n=1 Tax=Streptomyces zaomyceticus TaxID=68286 RepID=UPI00364BA1EA